MFPGLTFFQKVTYPTGLSFIIFQILSVLFDSNRLKGNFSGTLWDYMGYIIMFPKISMGPITRFNDIDLTLELKYYIGKYYCWI